MECSVWLYMLSSLFWWHDSVNTSNLRIYWLWNQDGWFFYWTIFWSKQRTKEIFNGRQYWSAMIFLLQLLIHTLNLVIPVFFSLDWFFLKMCTTALMNWSFSSYYFNMYLYVHETIFQYLMMTYFVDCRIRYISM